VVGTILFLQAAADDSFFGKTFAALDNLVEANIKLFSELFRIKAFARSGLTASLMIVYVYVACLLFLVVARIALRVRSIFSAGVTLSVYEMQLRESAESRPVEHGCHLREFDHPTFLNSDGKKHLHGRPTIGLPIPRFSIECCAA
jgi:hypothetical protein